MIHEPIKMVITSSASVLFFVFLIVFIKKIMKRNVPLIFLLFLVSFLPLVSMLRSGLYESGDLGIHVSFAIPFFESLKEGNLFPVWDKYMLEGYGYPYFLFSYPLPYYLASLVHVLGFSFISSFKLIAAFSFIFSGFAMYFLVKEETKKEMAGLIAAIFYLFAPYHLVDLHFRFAIGEIIAFFTLPLTFYLLKKVSGSTRYKYFFFLSLSFGSLIISHQAIALIASIFLLLYVLHLYIKEKDLKSSILRIAGIFTGALITSFYWIPVIVESQYTHILAGRIYFSPLIDYIFSPSRQGLLYQGHRGELYFPIGYVHLPVLLITIFLFLVSAIRSKYFKKETVLLSGLMVSFIICLFMMLSVSRPLWDSLPLIKGFLFSYRFSMFCAFFSSIIAGIVLAKIKRKKIIYVILAITVLITILNWGNRRVIPQINDEVLERGLYKSLQSVGPGTTLWTNVDTLPQRKTNVILNDGKADIQEIYRNSTQHQYLIKVLSKNASFTDNTLFFPNWTIEVNNKKKIVETSSLKNGLVSFDLNPGLYLVELKFEDTKIQMVARWISLASFIILTFPLFKLIKTKK